MYPIVFPLDQYCRQADYLGAAPLHLAAEQGCPPVVQYLLEVTGAETNHRWNRCQVMISGSSWLVRSWKLGRYWLVDHITIGLGQGLTINNRDYNRESRDSYPVVNGGSAEWKLWLYPPSLLQNGEPANYMYIYIHVIRVLCPKVFRDNCRNPYFWLWGVVQVLRVTIVAL